MAGRFEAGILRLLHTTPCYPWLRIFDRALMRSFRCADQGGSPSRLCSLVEESSVVSFIATVNRKPKLYIYIYIIGGQKLLRVTRGERVRSLVRETFSFDKRENTKEKGRTQRRPLESARNNNCETVVYFLNQTNISIEEISNHEPPPFNSAARNNLQRSVPPRRIKRYVANSRR